MYWEMFDVLESLLDGQAKIMLQAIRNYSQYGEVPDFASDPLLATLWMLVKPKIDADSDRYEKIREQKVRAGKASAEKRYSQANECQQPLAAVSECQQIQPTTTATSTTTAEATARTETTKGIRDKEKRDKGLTFASQPTPPISQTENFELEERKRAMIGALLGQEVNGDGL